MRRPFAALILVRARARRRPARWVMPALGIGLAVAFALCVSAEGVIAGDQAARSQLAGLSALDRTVRVTWQGRATLAVAGEARTVLRKLGLGSQTEVTTMNPVRLSGVIVRPVAISPLGGWFPGARAVPCGASDCPMILAGGGSVPRVLSAAGVRLRIVRSEPLRSSVPLAFATTTGGQWPVLVTGDVAGLDAIRGLSGVYRTHTRLAALNTTRLHSWQLAAVGRRLARAQAGLDVASGEVSFTAPFDGLDAARSRASAAPGRLMLVGGGVLACLVVFVVLAAGGLRIDQRAELERLRAAGASAGQELLFVTTEAGWICAVAMLAGAGVGILAASLIADGAGEPVAGVLTHSVLAPVALAALLAAWVVATCLIAICTLARSKAILDLLAVAAVSVLVAGLAIGSAGGRAWTLLVAPLCCLAAAVVVFRATEPGLRALERVARRGPVPVRLALVGLARAPALPALAIAFVAVSIGLGGFALAYRATLLRGAADQAAARVPSDALVSPGANFATPLELASLGRWQKLAGGTVMPVRTTTATYANGSASVTVPALGVPAGDLHLMHGWRSSNSSVPLAELARRLRPPGPVRAPGPGIESDARSLSVGIYSPSVALSVTADLRGSQGAIRQVSLGVAASRFTTLRAALPAGRWELEALQLTESSGLEITNGHQNAENPAAATQATDPVTLGPIAELGAGHRALTRIGVGGWRGVGAATTVKGRAGAEASIEFQTSGSPGVIRPLQPSDTTAIPVLADPHTAAAAGPGGDISLTVDELPVRAHVVGVARGFPTLAPGAGGLIVADQALLSSALDAQLPGQGLPDELWIQSARQERLRAALHHDPLSQLSSLFRADLQRQLSDAPIARGVLRALLAAATLAGVLAVLGMVLALVGALRERSVERDLAEQGLGPRALRSELQARFVCASVLGAAAGLGLALLLTRLATGSVRAAVGEAHPQPPLITVAPWGQLMAWTVGAVAILALAGWVATRWVLRGGGPDRPAPARGALEPDEIATQPAIR